MIPKEGEAVWRLMGSASFYVVTDTERAGKSLVTVAVRDLDSSGRFPIASRTNRARRVRDLRRPGRQHAQFFADA